MKALYLVSSKKKLSWGKASSSNAKKQYIEPGVFDKIRLYFNCCPNKELAKMFEKGSEMLDEEFNYLKLII
jgi:hypothetical protein